MGTAIVGTWRDDTQGRKYRSRGYLSHLSIAATGATFADRAHVTRVPAATIDRRGRLDTTIDRHGRRRDFVVCEAPDVVALGERFATADLVIGKSFPPLDRWERITVGTASETDHVLSVVHG